MAKKGARPELAVASIAARQHGVVTTRQLLSAGLASGSISDRIEEGRLHRIHRGVYAVGHRGLSRPGFWMAAVLASAQEERSAFLSHRSAAELWELLPLSRGLIDVSVPGDGGRKKRVGLRVHRSVTLKRSVRTRRLGFR